MAANKKRKGLGSLGIDILLSSPAKVASKAEEPLQATSVSMADQLSIAIDLVDRSPFQPRQTMTDEGLQELADSIRSQGLIQPIVVRKTADRYELIAGERRWRAAQIAGLQDIPAVIKQADDQAAAAMALIENLQRENLNPVEEAIYAGFDNNAEYLMSGLNQAIKEQSSSPHELHFLPNTGHVPTNKEGLANDLVDNFIDRALATNPPQFGL